MSLRESPARAARRRLEQMRNPDWQEERSGRTRLLLLSISLLLAVLLTAIVLVMV